MTRFKLRADETTQARKRTFAVASTSKAPVARAPVGPEFATINSFGLTNQHISLCMGITLPPERKTGLLRSLGPMAQAILLIREKTYKDKIRVAFENSIMMLPMYKELAQCFANAEAPSTVSGVMKELGDLLLLTTARNTGKVYFPIMMIRYIVKKSLLTNFNFAGTKALITYNNVTEKMQFNVRTGGTASQTAQAIFHAMFGTYMGEISSLRTITTEKDWQIRKTLDNVFIGRSTKAQRLINPIRFIKISKMSQALKTKMMGTMDPMIVGISPFAGRSQRNFSERFLNYILHGKNTVSFGTDANSLRYSLKKLKDDIFVGRSEAKFK